MTYEKVLVTGGAGCIGLAVCSELIGRGVKMHLFDLPEQVARVQAAVPAGSQVSYGSILDTSSLRDAIAGCDGVIHLAAYLGVRRTESNQLRCMEINVQGTKNVLDCAVQEGVGKIVFASSSEVYGEPAENPIDESFATPGRSVYAVSKLAGEHLCRAYAQRYPKLDFTVLRYFNTFGPYQVAQFVIPKFIRSVMAGNPPTIYGDGSQTRSYCYAADTARATVEALQRPATNGEIVNVGNSGEPLSLTELAQLVIRLCGKESGMAPVYREFERADRSREREIFVRFCNTAKARRLLDYVPAMSIEDGIRRVIEHGPIDPKWATSDVDYTIDDWV